MDGIERRSRLVSLAYQMIGAVDAPADASEAEVLYAGSRIQQEVDLARQPGRLDALRASPPTA